MHHSPYSFLAALALGGPLAETTCEDSILAPLSRPCDIVNHRLNKVEHFSSIVWLECLRTAWPVLYCTILALQMRLGLFERSVAK
ncbi:hypothetical protein BJX66DRAFT_127730 [Aspergillus keveii]|uniref:Secreted protein n=1 Tax=Aspergillus keveii TaxID=714993 RepID=A0ABR4FJJ7_9EURO